ncbi:MAG: hypothetical protein AAF226_15880, partial [Verrucomicrobiota bacterium]
MKYYLLTTLYALAITGPTKAAPIHPKAQKTGRELAAKDLANSDNGITEKDLKAYLERLCSDQFEGRLTGEPGDYMAGSYFGEFIKKIGLQPAADNGTYFEQFDFEVGKKLTGDNYIQLDGSDSIKPGDQYQPLSLSKSGDFDGKIVFAGFGINDDK